MTTLLPKTTSTLILIVLIFLSTGLRAFDKGLPSSNIAGTPEAVIVSDVSSLNTTSNFEYLDAGDNKSAESSSENNMEAEAICPPPIIMTQPEGIIACLGSSVIFSVVANTNGPGTIVYQWKKGAANISGATGSSFSISSVTVASAGSYTVAITKSCGATVTSVAAVLTVNNVNGGTISGTQTICVGITASAITSASNGSGSGTLSYQWEESPDMNSWSPIGGATGLTYSPGALTSTKHFRRAIASLLNGNTCDAYSNIISITVTQVTASVSSNSPLCEGGSLSLQATGGASYSWSGPDGFSGTEQNPGVNNVVLSASGTYSVTVTNATGCSATVTEAVTINPKPSPTATNNSPLCEGASLSLSSCGGTSFLWDGPASFSSTNKSSSISEVSIANAGDYNVIVTNSYGCTGVAVTTVVVNPGPAVAANNNGPYCEGGEATLTASGGNSYSWTGPNGFSSSDQSPVVSMVSLVSGGTYVVTVTNSNGCSATAPTMVVINAAPAVSISSLSEVNVGGLISLNSDGGVTYQWSGPNGFSSTEQNPNISDATLAQGGTYTVIVTSSEGCSASASISVTVVPAAPAGASNDGPADEGGTITLSAGEGEAFYWEGPNSFTSTEQTVVIENASSENAGTYTVTVTDANGNTYISSTDVVIFPAPSAASNSPACEGSIINLSADGGNSYAWQGPNGFTSTEQNPIIQTSSITNAGTYTVIVTRSDGSTRTATVAVAINSSYNVTASPVVSCNDYTLAWDQTVTSSGEYSHRYSSVHDCDSVVNVNVTINSSYNLEGAAVTACDNHTLPWGTNVTASGDYSQTYTSLNGCDSVVSVHVTIDPTYHITEPAVNACDGYTLPWGEAVTATGDYSHTYSSITTCDSTINVHVNVHSSYHVTGTAVSACDSHTLPWGDVVTSEGNYSHTYSSVNGCDSTVTIYVDVHNSYNVVGIPVKDCDSHTMPWGTVVTTSGNYSHTYTTAGGCDSTVAIHVTINHRYNLTGNAVASCTSYTLPWGEVATTTDNYDYTYTAVGGCDSTVTIHVTINNATSSSFNASACGSYTLPWGGSVSSSGNYAHTYSTVNGCDSVVTAHVTINNSAASSLNATACGSYTLPWGGSVSVSGNYTHTYSTVNGCDSVVTAHVTINNSAASSFNAAACGSYTLPWGASVSSSGNYAHTYSTVNGCDSVVTAHVTINNSAASSLNATACGSYTLPWGGSVSVSGNYTHTYSTVNGCDSVVTAHVTINQSPSALITGANTVCNGGSVIFDGGAGYASYLWSTGATTQTISASVAGTYVVTVTDANGCTANASRALTVNPGPMPAITGNNPCMLSAITLDAGAGYSSYLWSTGTSTRTILVSTAGTYSVTVTNSNGCTGIASTTMNTIVGSPVTHNPYTDFNASPNSGTPTSLWLNMHTKLNSSTDLANNGDYIMITNVTLTLNNISSNPPVTNVTVPNGKIIADNTVSSPVTSYDAVNNMWITKVPPGYTSSNIFITAAIVNSSNGFSVSSGKSSTVTATWKTNKLSGFSSSWFYGLSAYQPQFSYSSVSSAGQVAAISSGVQSGTPIPQEGNLVAGGSGGGGSNYTGSNSSTDNFLASNTPTATASNNGPVIGGNTLNLSSGGGSSYSWAGPNDFASSLQNPSIDYAAAAMEGTYTVTVTNSSGCTATATTTVDVTCSGFKSYTITQSGWGANPTSNNPAVYRNANFPYAFPNGLTVGCGSNWLNLTTSLAVQDFLPSSGTANALSQSYTNPGASLSNALAGQVAALALNIGFDNYDTSFAPLTDMHLQDMYVKKGTFVGWTVLQVFNEAQAKLGGCTSLYTASALNTVCTSINENYDGGKTDKGFLSCMPIRMENQPTSMSGSSLKIYPNPNNGIFMINLSLNETESSVDIQIVNTLGQVVYNERTQPIDGKIEKRVSLDNDLPSGNYAVRVITSKEVLSQPLIFQR